MKFKMKFEGKLILSALVITLIPLIVSYVIFVNDRVSSHQDNIKKTLKDTASLIVQNDFIKETLDEKEDDGRIQEYSKTIISEIDDIDIIVICDMNGRKYSHLDESQIGEIFVNPDKIEVLSEGTSYYSLMEGSMGVTLRWFQPIMYNEKQVGFIMIGKYYSDIVDINAKTHFNYLSLFMGALIVSIIGAKIVAIRTKHEILDMEPEEIATLYKQKKIIINSVQDGIIALNKENKVTQVNNSCFTLFDDFSTDKVIERLKDYIDSKETFKMKELIIDNKKIFVTLNPIMKDDQYLGKLIILSEREGIKKVAKEITGVDEIIKNLRANVHEFKNNLHVILGLIQLGLYNEAKDFILQIQKVEEDNSIEFSEIDDYYVRALLLSRKLVAKERKVKFILNEKSFLYSEHKIVSSKDLVTILGNLIENALEACALSNNSNKKVEVLLFEDEEKIDISVTDNGESLNEEIKNDIFIEGVSSKGHGRGTGLYLVKNRVELYNGNIEIKENTYEKTFLVSIKKGE